MRRVLSGMFCGNENVVAAVAVQTHLLLVYVLRLKRSRVFLCNSRRIRAPQEGSSEIVFELPKSSLSHPKHLFKKFAFRSSCVSLIV